MNPISHYLNEVKAKLAASSLVRTVAVVNEYLLIDRGYVRLRLILRNGNFLELSEYFVLEGETLTTLTYRYQWMDTEQGCLIKRWDNAPHFPRLANFPHHLHVGSEEQVRHSEPMNILGVLDLVEQELAMKQE